MKKERLTLEAIKQDLMKIVNIQLSNKATWRFSYIIPITAVAIGLGVFLENIFIGLLIFSGSVYHIVRFIIEFMECRTKRVAIVSMIERGEISISTERFSHIANKTIYEPHHGKIVFPSVHNFHRWAHVTRTITLYHFDGGTSWRLPSVHTHYSWSKEFYISSKGLENLSIMGDEFYFISLQAHYDIAYIYPCKTFELDTSLKNNVI